MGGFGVREYFGFIYDSSKLIPKPGKDGVVGHLYSNPFGENEYLKFGQKNDHTITNINSAYTRPPFGATFEYKKNHKDFTAVIAHLDSPGYGKAKSGKGILKNHSARTDPAFEYHSSSHPLPNAQSITEMKTDNVFTKF